MREWSALPRMPRIDPVDLNNGVDDRRITTREYTADTASARIKKYGFDTDLTRTFEYRDKASAAGHTDLASVELFIEILIRNEHATIADGTLRVADLDDLPVGSGIVRTTQFMELLQGVSDRGELHIWIADGLARLRVVSEWPAAADA